MNGARERERERERERDPPVVGLLFSAPGAVHARERERERERAGDGPTSFEP